MSFIYISACTQTLGSAQGQVCHAHPGCFPCKNQAFPFFSLLNMHPAAGARVCEGGGQRAFLAGKQGKLAPHPKQLSLAVGVRHHFFKICSALVFLLFPSSPRKLWGSFPFVFGPAMILHLPPGACVALRIHTPFEIPKSTSF